jgi:tetratricopeptide (TPR) repeat protein
MKIPGALLKKHARLIAWIVIVLLVVPGLNAAAGNNRDVNAKKLKHFKTAWKLFDVGKRQFVTEKYKKAERTFEKCLRAFPDFAIAGYYLAQIHYKKGDYQRALKNIEASKNSFERLAEFIEASKHLYNENLEDQRRGLETYLNELYDYVLVRNCLAYRVLPQATAAMATEKGEMLAKSMAPKTALKGIPAGYFYAHGNILFKLKRYAGARDQYLAAIKIDPRHRKAYNNLINLYYSARKYQKARYYLEQAGARGVDVNSRLKDAVYAHSGE